MKQRISDRERQYRLDASMFAWTLAFRRWQADDTQPFPIPRPFADGLPLEDAVRLMDYALDAIIDGLPEPMSAADDDDEPETLELSPAGERALAAIRAQSQQEGQGK